MLSRSKRSVGTSTFAFCTPMVCAGVNGFLRGLGEGKIFEVLALSFRRSHNMKSFIGIAYLKSHKLSIENVERMYIPCLQKFQKRHAEVKI